MMKLYLLLLLSCTVKNKDLIQLPSLLNCEILHCSNNYLRELSELPKCYQLWCK